jgi:molybdopterin/thiamine biosynthesis adenylyltransferase
MEFGMSGLFARVRPVVGEALSSCRVAVVGLPAAGVLVEYLAACGVWHWLVMAGNGWMGAQAAKLRERYGKDFNIHVVAVDSTGELGAADLAIVVDDAAVACRLPVMLPRLAIFTPNASYPCRAFLALAGEAFDLPCDLWKLPSTSPRMGWDWLTAAPLMALWARALLLRGSAYAMATWEDAWTRGVRAYTVGAPDDPTCAAWQASRHEAGVQPVYRTPRQRRGTLLVVGLGSLGSVAAQQLAPWVERMVLVDPDRVEVVNLMRQGYGYYQLGKAKAVALAEALGMIQDELVCAPVVACLRDEREVAMLIHDYGVTAALVTTGSQADFAITRALRAAAIPHVVGRCYARARYWEGIVVDGAHGSCYEQVRREVAAGPTPAPTVEEVAAYGAVGELVAEPATAMECGWAAMWLARLVTQMMTPPTLREGWLWARLAAGATCLIGGLVVEQGVDRDVDRAAGGAAYGIAVPGEVRAWSLEEIG